MLLSCYQCCLYFQSNHCLLQMETVQCKERGVSAEFMQQSMAPFQWYAIYSQWQSLKLCLFFHQTCCSPSVCLIITFSKLAAAHKKPKTISLSGCWKSENTRKTSQYFLLSFLSFSPSSTRTHSHVPRGPTTPLVFTSSRPRLSTCNSPLPTSKNRISEMLLYPRKSLLAAIINEKKEKEKALCLCFETDVLNKEHSCLKTGTNWATSTNSFFFVSASYWKLNYSGTLEEWTLSCPRPMIRSKNLMNSNISVDV